MRLIDADALKKYVKQQEDYDSSYTICAYIDNAPTVEGEILTKEAYSDLCLRASQARPQGEWIDDFRSDYEPFMQRGWKCTNCGKRTTYGKPAFCMYCGAEMRKGGK